VIALVVQFEHCQKRFLRNFHVTYLAHSFLTLFLFFEEFPFTADITTITFGSNVFSQCRNSFPGNYLRSNRCLDCNLELLAWQQFFEFFTKLSSEILSTASVNQGTKSIHFFAIEQDIHFDNITITVTNRRIIE